MIAPGSIEAPAKINLTLEVLDRQPDGYHRLRSVMVPIALYDRMTWKPSDRFSLQTADPALATNNLVERALRALGGSAIPVELHLEKGIPVGGGLGGGSSDAAAILRAAMHGAFGDFATVDWVAAARALGSDVPFFLTDGPALVEGTGERVTPLGSPPPWWLCLTVPRVSVATAQAYRELDAAHGAGSLRRPRSDSASVRAGEALQRGDFAAVQALLHNDFEPVIAGAYRPIGAALEALRAAGAERPMLSGSGAATFALCRTQADAQTIAQRLTRLTDAHVAVVAFAASPVWTATP